MRDIFLWGKIWTRWRAGKVCTFYCFKCGNKILVGKYYYLGIVGGSGVGGMVRPDRVCEKCLTQALED